MVSLGDSSQLIKGFRLALIVQGLRPHTIECYIRDVTQFADWLGAKEQDILDATSTHVREYLGEFKVGHAPATLRHAQLSLRRLYRFLVAEEEMTKDPTKEMGLTRLRVVPQPTYTEAEVRRLLMVCPNTKEGVRNRAMVMVLFDTGVREGELLSMVEVDWNRRQTRVDGKTGVRDVPLGLSTLQALERYTRRWRVNGAGGSLWRGKRGPMTGSGVRQMVRNLAATAGITYKGVHAFRRTAAAQMKRLGMNDSDILENMGWKNVEMLRRYTAAVSAELAQAAHARFSPGDALRIKH